MRRHEGKGGEAPAPRTLRRSRSTSLAECGWRRDGGPRCRAVHVPGKPKRRLIPASAPAGGHGHQFRRGMGQPELRVSPRVSPRWVVLPFQPSVTRRATILRTGPGIGFILALSPLAGKSARRCEEPSVRIVIPYSQEADFDRVNYAGIGDVLGVPASSRRPELTPPAAPPSPLRRLTRGTPISGPVAADRGQSEGRRMPAELSSRCRV